MNTSNLSRGLRRAAPAAIITAAIALAGCSGGGVIAPPDTGGGGTSATATPYTLFASNYVAYPAQTNGAFLHSVQGGDVYATFGGNIGYGCFSFGQGTMDSNQFYGIQAQANSDGGGAANNCQSSSNVVPNTAADFASVTIKAPGTNSPAATAVTPLDIGQSGAMLIQMGNIYTQGDVPGAIGGKAAKFTVELNNDTSLAGDGSGQTALCSVDQILGTIGRGGAAPLGVLNYVIPFASFTCSKGTVDLIKSTGVTAVTVRFSGDKQTPALDLNELDVIAVGYIGFTK